jgi:hypothetical protein
MENRGGNEKTNQVRFPGRAHGRDHGKYNVVVKRRIVQVILCGRCIARLFQQPLK